MDLQEHMFKHAYAKDIDVESFRYPVLGFLQKALIAFRHFTLYGYYSELTRARENLIEILQFLKEIESSQTWSAVKLDSVTLNMLRDISSISNSRHVFLKEQVLWMLDELDRVLFEGYQLAEFIRDNITVHTVGCTPESFRSGYWILNSIDQPCMWTYSYSVDRVYVLTLEDYTSPSYSIKTRCVGVYGKSESFLSVKDRLVRKHFSVSVPMVYCVESGVEAPLEETIVPIAKRLLLGMVRTQSLQYPPP